MEVFHHYGIKLLSDADRKAFSEVGIELEPGARIPNGPIFVGLDIGELDKRWPSAQAVIQRYKITEFFFTKFSEPELDGARALCMLGQSQRGYPQPEENFGFLAETYDLTDYCSRCGNGYRQNRPFRVKSVPVLKRNVMQLNWVFDEFFVARDVWTEVFRPMGIDCWPVILHKSGKEIESVVQLKIVQRVQLHTKPMDGTGCKDCGRSKIPLDLRGFSPAPMEMPAAICRSAEGFGAGRAAFNRVMISDSLYRRIKQAKLRGVQFYPSDSGS